MEDADALVDRLAALALRVRNADPSLYLGIPRQRGGDSRSALPAMEPAHARPGKPQSQEVVVRYDSVDLAVLGVTARLDGVAVPLSPLLNTPRDASARGTETYGARGVPTSITLETVSGERFEMPLSSRRHWFATGDARGLRSAHAGIAAAADPDIPRQAVSGQWGGKIDRLSHASLGGARVVWSRCPAASGCAGVRRATRTRRRGRQVSAASR